MRQEDVNQLLEVGVLLSSERDLNRLLGKILRCVMDLTHCDAGTLYLLDGGALRFQIMRNHTLRTDAGWDGTPPDLPPVPLTRESVCALAVLEDRTIAIEDVRNCGEYDLTGPLRYDAITGYTTRSMLVAPMRNREGEAVGVLQLINAMDGRGGVRPFAQDTVLAVESVASQAALAIQNVRYIEEIKELFRSFVRAMSAAVDERTPYNASHSRHMAAYGQRFLRYLSAQPGQRAFSPAQEEEMTMSILLHDIGKLVTPLEVMNKMTRLLPEQRAAFLHRMEVVRLRGEIDRLSGRVTEREAEALNRETREAEALVEAVNGTGFVTDGQLEALRRLGQRTYIEEDGRSAPWLTEEERRMLSIRKGTLSPEERAVMEEHVVVTDKLLAQIQFPPDMARVRQWAAAHHELLDGSGYPCRRRGEEIPREVRIITILDIFDALTADDRPYKPGMPVEKALSILESMAEREGKLDPELTRLFIASRCWEEAKKQERSDTK